MNKEDKVLLMNCLTKLNKAIKDSIGHYDLNDSVLQNFIKTNSISIEKYGKRNLKKMESKKIFILSRFESEEKNKTNSSAPADRAHDILRHFRNAIAHSLVTKPRGKDFYEIKDYNKNSNQTMFAHIRIDLFESLIDEIIKTDY